jgi:hypothetical protein
MQVNRTFFIAIIAAASLALGGCHAPPLATTGTNNASVDVELLFTHDGCKVYRFKDAVYHYFVRCDTAGAPPQATTLSSQSRGIYGTYEESIPTSLAAAPVKR